MDINTSVSLATITGGGFLRAPCFNCWNIEGVRPKKRNLAISVTTGWYRCWKCGHKGNTGSNFDFSAYRNIVVFEKDEFDPPIGYTKLSPSTDKEVYDYVISRRRVPPKVLQTQQIGVSRHCVFGSAVVIPVLVQGRWRGWVQRFIRTGEYRYPYGMKRGEILYNSDQIHRYKTIPLLVVEGVFDALPHWPHAVALFGKPSNRHIEMLASIQRPIAVCLDADAQGESWALAELLKLRGADARFVKLPPGLDPGDMTTDSLLSRVIREF